MGFKDINKINFEYYTNEDDVINNFYIPILEEATYYNRAVGFFSSNILLEASIGLYNFVKRGGKMKLIIAPKLSEEDYNAIKEGYSIQNFMSDYLDSHFDESIEAFQKEDRFGLLSLLIRNGFLDIKVAYLEKNNNSAMFHSKFGILFDDCHDMISFSGSSNESANGFINNAEQIDVYCSWISQENSDRCLAKSFQFNKLWNGTAKGIIVIPFPDVIKNKLMAYEKSKTLEDYNDIDKKLIEYISKKRQEKKLNEVNIPKITEKIHLYDYQQAAISNWEKENFKGIFDMATGTGKTYTAYGAIVKIFEVKKRLITIICCPFTHLVDQWCEDSQGFNIIPIKCYGNFSNYEKDVSRQLIKFKQRLSNFVCLIVCNATFRTEKFQNLIKDYIDKTLLIVDEAHNFGAYSLTQTLSQAYPYRLALSATLERYGDPEGTAKLLSFFGNKCIEYTLEKAITEKKLTPYKYYPIVVSLNDYEWSQYIELSKKIGKQSILSDSAKNNQKLKSLLIKRARLIASAEEKISKLVKIMKDYKNQSNMLIYCGAVKYGDYGYDDTSQEIKQVNLVIKLLYQNYKMRLRKFTSDESTEDRKNIKEDFASGIIQALVAIKCLDEGVNIPAIKTAFILASSTNPKEYIQRRGRVLRLSPGKEFAEIYDFIVLPNGLEGIKYDINTKKIARNLAKRELIRVKDFAKLAINGSSCNEIINTIQDNYDINYYMNDEEEEEDLI